MRHPIRLGNQKVLYTTMRLRQTHILEQVKFACKITHNAETRLQPFLEAYFSQTPTLAYNVTFFNSLASRHVSSDSDPPETFC
jgi:hypothetical protein